MTEGCGFTTIVIGTFLLHATRELDISLGEAFSLFVCLIFTQHTAINVLSVTVGMTLCWVNR